MNDGITEETVMLGDMILELVEAIRSGNVANEKKILDELRKIGVDGITARAMANFVIETGTDIYTVEHVQEGETKNAEQ